MVALTDIGTINEAEEIEEGDGGNDVQIDLPAKPRFGSWVELHERATIPLTVVSTTI
jgi:hypothetical protein